MITGVGKCCQNSVNQMSFGESRKSLKNKVTAQNSRENCNAFAESCKLEKPGSSDLYDEYLWFGHRGNGGTEFSHTLSQWSLLLNDVDTYSFQLFVVSNFTDDMDLFFPLIFRSKRFIPW